MINIHKKTLQDLEFATVLEQLSKYCVTSLGNQKASEIEPFQDKETLLNALLLNP